MVLKSLPYSPGSVGAIYMGSSADIVKDHSTLKLLTHMNDLTFDKNPESIARICLAFMYAVDGFLYEVQMDEGKNAKCVFGINGEKFEIIIEGLKGVEEKSEKKKIEPKKEHIIIDRDRVYNRKEIDDGEKDKDSRKGDEEESTKNKEESKKDEEYEKDDDIIVIDISPKPTHHVSAALQPDLTRSSSKLGTRTKLAQGLSQATSKSPSVKKTSGSTNTSLASQEVEFIPNDKWTSDQDKFIIEAVRDGMHIRELTKHFNERFGTALGPNPIRRRFSTIADSVDSKRVRPLRSPSTPDSEASKSSLRTNASLNRKSKSISPVTSARVSDCYFDSETRSESSHGHKSLPQRPSSRQSNPVLVASVTSISSPMQTNKNDQRTNLKRKWALSKSESDEVMNEISLKPYKRGRKSTGSTPLKPSELNTKKVGGKRTEKLKEKLFTPNKRPPVVTLINDNMEVEQVKEKGRDIEKRPSFLDTKNEENCKSKHAKIVKTQSVNSTEKQIATEISRRICSNEKVTVELNKREKNAGESEKNSHTIDSSVLVNTDGRIERRSLSNSAKPVKKRLNIRIDEAKKSERKKLKRENNIDDGIEGDPRQEQNGLSRTSEFIPSSIDIYSPSNSANTKASLGGATGLKVSWGSSTGGMNGCNPRKPFNEQSPSSSSASMFGNHFIKSMASIPSSREVTPLGWTWASDFPEIRSEDSGQHKD